MRPGPGVNPAAPEITVGPEISCGAGIAVVLEVDVRHPGPQPARMTVMVLGLDPGWVPAPLLIALQPGESTRVDLEIRPAPGAMSARYPFVVAVESLDPLGTAGPVMSTAESTLAVGSRERAVVVIDPVQATAVFGRKFRLRITNPSRLDRELTVHPNVPQGVSLRLPDTAIGVPAGRTISVPGRVRIRKPRMFGTSEVHTYAVTVRGQGAPVVVEGTVRARPVFRGALVRSLAVVLVVALWVGLAVVAIPRITSYFSSNSGTTARGVTGAEGTGAGGAPSAGGAPGSDGSTGAGGSAGPDGSAGAGSGPGAAGAAASGERLRGLVTGQDPGGVTVVLAPTSLVEAAAAGAQAAAGVTDQATASGLRAAVGAVGKIPATALRLVKEQDPPTVITETAPDGTFSMAGIRAPGFYLLTFARAGYQTQRFIVNAGTLAAADPIKVKLTAGRGTLSGSVNSAAGPVGAAGVTITDGRVSLQTSTVSVGGDGTPGTWNVTGLSTPATYLISVATPGFGTASSLVTVGAGGSETSDLTLVAGVAAITGQVSGRDQLGRLGGIGGISVAVTGQSGDVTTTRTATTVTSGPVGRFTLPDLPTPGDYTLTVSGPGYQHQVRQVSLAAGAGAVDLDISLTRADGVVTGTVVGDPAANGQPAEGGLVGAGLTLTGPAGAVKTMTTSDPPGSFRFTGVPPGVYVLAGSMFGRVPSSVTVEVTAAGDVVANLTLLSAADTELPATAKIKGRVVDARTGNPLTCDRSAHLNDPCLVTASVMAPVIDPSTGRIDPSAPKELLSGQNSPTEDYVLPAAADSAHSGLVAGLYTVNLTAPGYEPASTSVQVAQGSTTQAPQVAMAPLGMIAGRITTQVGFPAGATCVVVTPAGAAAPPAGASCTANSDTVTCLVGADPSFSCGLVQADGTYQVRGLVHGGYTVFVLPTDREFVPPAPFNITVEIASDATYNPVLDRLGRISVTVKAPDPDTAELAPVAGALVAAKLGGSTKASATSGTDGSALLVGLQGMYSLAASGDRGAASIDQTPVQLNQTVEVTMVLTAPIGTVVGRVQTNDGSPNPVGVAGVTVTVIGIISYSGITPNFGSAKLISDDNGCFAILPTPATAPPGPSAVCGTSVTAATALGTVNIANSSLVARPVSVQVDGNSKVQGSFVAQVAIAGDVNDAVKTIPIDATTVKPQPSPTTGLRLASNPVNPGPARNTATISVLGRPPGAGQVAVVETSVGADGVGTLLWSDPAIGPSNLAAPGKYTLQATLPGWATATATVTCPLGAPCVFDGAGFTLVRNPTFAGTVSLLPSTDTADRSQGVYSVLSGPTPLPVIDLNSNSSGVLTWQEAGAPVNLIRPGTYRIGSTLTGFESRPVTFVCAAGAGNCNLSLSLRRLAQANLNLRSTGSLLPLGASVRLTGTSIGEQTLTAPANSSTVALPSLSTFDTSYAVEVRAAGSATTTTSLSALTCTGPAGIPTTNGLHPGANTCTLRLTQLGRIPLRTWQAGTDPTRVALSSVAVTAQLIAPLPISPEHADPYSTTTAANGTGTITGTNAQEGLIDGTYQITATKVGYDDLTGTVRIQGGQLTADSPAGLPIVAGQLDLALNVQPVTMPVQLLSNDVAILPGGTITLRGNNITRTCTLVTTAGVAACTPVQANTTAVNGTGPTDSLVAFGNLFPAVYTVTFISTDNRYRTQTIQTQLNPGTAQPPVVLILDLRASTQTGTVLDPTGQPLAGAVVSLRPDANVESVAKDIDGADLVTTTAGTAAGSEPDKGTFTLDKIPDGLYRVMVDAPGWYRIFSATITMNSQLTTTPPALTLRLTTRIQRSVVVTLTSTAGNVSLAGAAVTVNPVPGTQPAGTPENTTLTGFTVSGTGPYTVTAAQVPTGQWTLAVTMPAGPDFGAFGTPTFTVDDPPRPRPALPPDTNPPSPPVPVSQSLQQAVATITVNWPVTCSAPPASGTLPIDLTRDGVTRSVSATVTARDRGAGTAVATVLLPSGSYTWVAKPPAPAPPATATDLWTGGSGAFDVVTTGTPPVTAGSTGPLTPPGYQVLATLRVDGNPVGDHPITPLPPTGPSALPVRTDASGAAPFCLAAANNWGFSVRDSGTPLFLVPDQTDIVVPGTDSTVAVPVSFAGYTFQPTVRLASPTGRTPDATTRDVDLALSLGGDTVWSGTVTIPANETSVTGPKLTVGAGSYTLTATPSGSAFGVAGQTNIDPSTTHSLTVTLPYRAVMMTVTASVAGTPTEAVSVALGPSTGTGSPQLTDPSGATTFRDIPAATYTVTGTITISGTAYQGTVSGQELAAGTSAAMAITLTAATP